MAQGVAVTQEIEQVVYQSEDRRLDRQLLRSACWHILGQDAEPRVGPYDSCKCVNVR